jgi:hypothetical protein
MEARGEASGTRPPSERPERPGIYFRPALGADGPVAPGAKRRPRLALPATGQHGSTGNGRPSDGLASGAERQPLPPPVALSPPGEPMLSIHALSDFAVKLSLGPLPTLWLVPVAHAVQVLLAEAMWRPPGMLRSALSRLYELLVNADQAAAIIIDASRREEMLVALSALPALVQGWPESARDLGQAARLREQRILRELCGALDGLTSGQRGRLELEQRLESLSGARTEELAQWLQTPIERASTLSAIAVAYRLDWQSRAPDVGNCMAIERALDELEQSARALAAFDDEQGHEQRHARRRRREALTRVNLLLAERGELSLLQTLEPCAALERIERLRAWLPSASGAAAG